MQLEVRNAGKRCVFTRESSFGTGSSPDSGRCLVPTVYFHSFFARLDRTSSIRVLFLRKSGTGARELF